MQIFKMMGFGVLTLVGSLALASESGSVYSTSATRTLGFVQEMYAGGYAPSLWKRDTFGWDLDVEIAKAEQAISHLDSPRVRDYQKVLRGFFQSTRDYHVAVWFHSTELATLPFSLKSAEGRYFVSWVDRDRAGAGTFSFDAGDEITEFGGEPIAQVVQKIQADLGSTVPETDHAIAERVVTKRAGTRAIDVPQGAVLVKGIKKDGSPVSQQLAWDYTPERIQSGQGGLVPDQGLTGISGTPLESATPKWAFLKRKMLSPVTLLEGRSGNQTESQPENKPENKQSANPYILGARSSFLPRLGSILWESAPTDPFDAYLTLDDNRRVVGFVRIPSYSTDDSQGVTGTQAAAAFATLMLKFESQADVLVIDQLNNPGGSVFYLYALASMLTDKPLATPRHRMTILPQDIAEASEMLEALKTVNNDADARQVLGEDWDGYPMSYQTAQFSKSYCEFLIAQYAQGKTLSDPYWIYGTDHINPSSVARFTKPVLVLTNELDFSGGDFFPAIMQDNQRATLLGTRTSGAGGYVLEVTVPSRIGLAGFTYTGSIAERADGNPIENLGVKPEIPVALTPADLQNNYVDYMARVKEALSKL